MLQSRQWFFILHLQEQTVKSTLLPTTSTVTWKLTKLFVFLLTDYENNSNNNNRGKTNKQRTKAKSIQPIKMQGGHTEEHKKL